MFGRSLPESLVRREDALPGHSEPIPGLQITHSVSGSALFPPFPEGSGEIILGMGCFWGAERKFWQLPGVIVTAVGYAGGFTPNPTYEEVCSGRTGHTEVVRVVFDPAQRTTEQILAQFWEGHNPTQGMRQGNDVGTQYRSAIYCTNGDQLLLAKATAERFGTALHERGFGDITTEISRSGDFYYAEAYHQQYLHKNPNGYCGLGGTGVSCPVGIIGGNA